MEHQIGIIMNGVTGRMGTNQHLIRSLLAIREQGGIDTPQGKIMPVPVLTGRNEAKLKKLSEDHGGLRYSTNLDELLQDDSLSIYFDAQTTLHRCDAVKRAIAAGKHIYCEKPVVNTLKEAMELYEMAGKAGVKHGVVQDKLWLPGLLKLKGLIDSGLLGDILSVRGEFGYWVFTGEDANQPIQRPSWNYRRAEGGGIIIDMLCHWRYVVDNLFGNITSLTCLGANHIKKRWDEEGNPYDADSDDSAYATFITDKDTVCHFNSSWCVRVRRDDLLTLQVDGTKGSAVAGLRDCLMQSLEDTPRPVWNPDIDSPIKFHEGWVQAPGEERYDNAFKVQWELFLRHVVCGGPFRWDIKEGAKGIQLAELGQESWKDRAWKDVPEL